MVNEEFEDGRRLQSLETQIMRINTEFSEADFDEETKNNLKEALKKEFSEYLNLAQKYHVNPTQIRILTNIYQKAIK